MNMQISKFSLLSHGNAWRAIKRSMCCVLDRLMNGYYGYVYVMLCNGMWIWRVEGGTGVVDDDDDDCGAACREGYNTTATGYKIGV